MLVLPVGSAIISGVDGMKERHGRHDGKRESSLVEIRNCRYCKAKFELDPRHPNKEFCKEGHRKLYWRYGSLSVTKVAERMQRETAKMLMRELTPLRARVAELERLVTEATEARAESSRALYLLERWGASIDAERQITAGILNAGGGAAA